MELQNILPLNDIFNNFERYVIIKKSSEFPQYLINQDIDILTDRIDKNINILINSYNKELFDHKISIVKENTHYHIDLFLKTKPNELHFRFDVFSILHYQTFSINQAIIKYIIDYRIKCSSIYIPKLDDDLSLRYAEYIEYQSNPKKIKHLHYTNNFKDVSFYKIAKNEKNSTLNYNSGNEKYFSFIIWSHGIEHIYEILELLKKHLYCKILLITQKKYSNINKFIDQIYALEMHNKNHIIGKTNYLKQLSNEYIYILIKKYDYNEKSYGKIQEQIFADEDVVKFKWLIREKYNPKLPNQEQQPSPSLPPGISHDHVIHATDTVQETEHLTKIIINKPNHYFEDKIVNNNIFIPYHINGHFQLREIPINDLLITIRISASETKNVAIQNSPHYQYVIGNTNIYLNYYKQFLGTFLTDDHIGSSFDNLINNFNPNTYNQFENKYIILVNKTKCILDGAHRLAILYKNDIKTVKVLHLQ